MKRLLSLFGILVMVTCANAQTSAPAQTTAPVKMTANRVTHDNRLPSVLLTDTVEIVFPVGITVTADEALVNPLSGSMELRGNVRLVAPPAMFRQQVGPLARRAQEPDAAQQLKSERRFLTQDMMLSVEGTP